MTGKPERGSDWSLGTWKGSRLQQHREFHALPFGRKLEVIEELSEMTALFRAPKPAALREEPERIKPKGAPGES